MISTRGRLAGRIGSMVQPTDAQVRAMLDQVIERHGLDLVAAMLNCSALRLQTLRRPGRLSAPVRRLVWILWAMSEQPAALRTWFGLVTWGRFERGWRGWPPEADPK